MMALTMTKSSALNVEVYPANTLSRADCHTAPGLGRGIGTTSHAPHVAELRKSEVTCAKLRSTKAAMSDKCDRARAGGTTLGAGEEAI